MRAAAAGFVRGYIVPRARMQPVRLVRTGANGRTAFAFYRERKGSFQLEAIQGVSARAGTRTAADSSPRSGFQRSSRTASR